MHYFAVVTNQASILQRSDGPFLRRLRWFGGAGKVMSIINMTRLESQASLVEVGGYQRTENPVKWGRISLNE